MNDASTITVRRLSAGDISQAGALFERVIPWGYEVNGLGLFKEKMVEEIAAKKQMLCDDVQMSGANYCFIVAMLDSRMVGIIAHGPANPLMDMCSEGASQGKRGISNLVVDMDFQGRGIAKKLFYAVLEVMRQDGFEEFCLDCGYQLAQLMWKSILGEPQFVKKDFWGDGIDHMGWMLPLPQ